MTSCNPCQRAGDLNRTGAKEETIRELHDDCEYPATCTCQHRIGVWHV